MLIDTGTRESAARILDFLQSRGIDALETLLLTHMDKDHIGGAAAILNAMPIGAGDAAGGRQGQRGIHGLPGGAGGKGHRAATLREAERADLGGAAVTLLPGREPRYKQSNDYSVFAEIVYGDHRFLFTGDGEKKRLQEYLDAEPKPCDFLKVPHHGRTEKNSEAFFRAVAPRYAVITCSEEEPPEDEVLALLQAAGGRDLSDQRRDGDRRQRRTDADRHPIKEDADMTEDRAANGRIGYMDGLRAAAMVGVILIHVCAKAAARFGGGRSGAGPFLAAGQPAGRAGPVCGAGVSDGDGGIAAGQRSGAVGTGNAAPAGGAHSGAADLLDGGISGAAGRDGTRVRLEIRGGAPAEQAGGNPLMVPVRAAGDLSGVAAAAAGGAAGAPPPAVVCRRAMGGVQQPVAGGGGADTGAAVARITPTWTFWAGIWGMCCWGGCWPRRSARRPGGCARRGSWRGCWSRQEAPGS